MTRINKSFWLRLISFLMVIVIGSNMIKLVSGTSEIKGLGGLGAAVSQEADVVKLTLDLVEKQDQIEKSLLSEFEGGGYTLEEPFVTLDPYGMSPLTAIAMFETDTPMQVSLHIAGDTKLADVDYKFDEYNTKHQIPIYGLYPGRVNEIELTATTQSGETQMSTIEIETEPVSGELSKAVVKSYLRQPEKYQSGFSFFLVPFIIAGAAMDVNGEYRWYLSEGTPASPLSNIHHSVGYAQDGTFYVGCGSSYSKDPNIILHMNMSGKILRAYTFPYGNHHEIFLTDHNTMYGAGENPDTPEISRDAVYEIDLETGEVLHFLDYKDVLMSTRTYDLQGTKDWCHINSVVENGDDIIVSCRNQSTVICNSWDGEIRWMLCEKTGYPSMYWDKILTPVGEDFEYFYSEHNATVLPDADNNPNTVDILLFDNGTARNGNNVALQEAIAKGEAIEPPSYSRMVSYRIDEVNMTVEQLWSYGKERPELFAPIRSGAQYLANGNYFGMFDAGNNEETVTAGKLVHSAFVEVDPDGEVVWESHIESTRGNRIFKGYRSKRRPLYESGANEEFVGVPAQILMPSNVLKRYGYKVAATADQSTEKKPETTKPVAQTEVVTEQTVSESAEQIWQMKVVNYEVHDSLHTIEEVPQYAGGAEKVPHDNAPSDGNQFLLIELDISKQGTGKLLFPGVI